MLLALRTFSSCKGAAASLPCGTQPSHCGDLSCWGAQALDAPASVAAAPALSSCGDLGLSCSGACGIFPDLGFERTRVPCIGRQILTYCATRKVCCVTFCLVRIKGGDRSKAFSTWYRDYIYVGMLWIYYLFRGWFLLADSEFANFPMDKNEFVTPKSILQELWSWGEKICELPHMSVLSWGYTRPCPVHAVNKCVSHDFMPAMFSHFCILLFVSPFKNLPQSWCLKHYLVYLWSSTCEENTELGSYMSYSAIGPELKYK